jgi:hypothetical protein
VQSKSYTMLLAECTVRARVAFVLAVAEAAHTSIETTMIMAERIRRALDLAWQWEQSGDVPGRALSKAVEGGDNDEPDENIVIMSCMVPEAQRPAWRVVMNAVLYTSWHAHLAAGDKKGISEIVNEIDENAIDMVMYDAPHIPGVDLRLADRLAQYCIDHHRTADPSALGEPIPREVMLQVSIAAG